MPCCYARTRTCCCARWAAAGPACSDWFSPLPQGEGQGKGPGTRATRKPAQRWWGRGVFALLVVCLEQCIEHLLVLLVVACAVLGIQTPSQHGPSVQICSVY